MNKKNHIRKISNYAIVGGLGSILVIGLVGCEDNSSNNQQFQNNSNSSNLNQQQGAFVIIEQNSNGQYKIVDEFPSTKTTVVLRSPDGSERILSQDEINNLVKEEEKRIDNGTSPLTNPDSQLSSGGMSLGGVLLSSIAGAMIGSWIGNKLFNNQNFQNQKAAQYKSPQTYSKSQSSFNKPASRTSTNSSSKKSGFFGGKSASTSNSSSFGG